MVGDRRRTPIVDREWHAGEYSHRRWVTRSGAMGFCRRGDLNVLSTDSVRRHVTDSIKAVPGARAKGLQMRADDMIRASCSTSRSRMGRPAIVLFLAGLVAAH